MNPLAPAFNAPAGKYDNLSSLRFEHSTFPPTPAMAGNNIPIEIQFGQYFQFYCLDDGKPEPPRANQRHFPYTVVVEQRRYAFLKGYEQGYKHAMDYIIRMGILDYPQPQLHHLMAGLQQYMMPPLANPTTPVFAEPGMRGLGLGAIQLPRRTTRDNGTQTQTANEAVDATIQRIVANLSGPYPKRALNCVDQPVLAPKREHAACQTVAAAEQKTATFDIGFKQNQANQLKKCVNQLQTAFLYVAKYEKDRLDHLPKKTVVATKKIKESDSSSEASNTNNRSEDAGTVSLEDVGNDSIDSGCSVDRRCGLPECIPCAEEKLHGKEARKGRKCLVLKVQKEIPSEPAPAPPIKQPTWASILTEKSPNDRIEQNIGGPNVPAVITRKAPATAPAPATMPPRRTLSSSSTHVTVTGTGTSITGTNTSTSGSSTNSKFGFDRPLRGRNSMDWRSWRQKRGHHGYGNGHGYVPAKKRQD